MKTRLYLLLLLFAASNLAGQEYITAFKTDDVSYFTKNVTPENINECHDIGNSKYNLLAVSIKTNATNIFNWLIENDADLEHSCSGKTALMYAVKYGKTDMAKKLIENDADLMASNSGKTALDYAKKYEQKELEKYLIKIINERNK